MPPGSNSHDWVTERQQVRTSSALQKFFASDHPGGHNAWIWYCGPIKKKRQTTQQGVNSAPSTTTIRAALPKIEVKKAIHKAMTILQGHSGKTIINKKKLP